MQKLTIEQAREQFEEYCNIGDEDKDPNGRLYERYDRDLWSGWLACLRANGLLVESET